MYFYIDFSLLAVFLIGFTAFIAVIVNAATNLLSNKEKKAFTTPLQSSQKNWKPLSNE
ncbi:MAG: hypothetical protein WBV93_11915 [Anaerobacillus sp.]